MKIMVADTPISVLHHAEKTYRPNRAGKFEIDDNHIDGVRPHGLMLEEEAETKKRTRAGARADADMAQRIAALEAENAALKAAAPKA